MSSLRALASLKLKGWTGVSSSIRNSAGTALLNSKNEGNHCSRASFYLSTAHRDQAGSSVKHTSDTVTSSAFDKRDLQSSGSVKDEIFNDVLPKKSTKSKTYPKDYQQSLREWLRQLNFLQAAGKDVQLSKIVGDYFPEVIKFSLTPAAESDMLPKCFALLLAEPTDGEICKTMLRQTAEGTKDLQIKDVTDIVLTLAEAAETPLRKQTRVELIKTIVSKRWYEISEKHVIFFMYQLDELFDMREISNQIGNPNKEQSIDKDSTINEDNDSSKNTDSDIKRDTNVMDGNTQVKKNIQKKQTASQPDANSDLPLMIINLEARAISLVNEMKVKDLARIVILLAKWRRRNQTLLNAVIHRLCQDDFTSFNFLQLSNFLFACSTLSLHNNDLLRRLTDQLSQNTITSPSLACSMLTSLSYLRWRDDGLIDKTKKYLTDRISSLGPGKASGVLMSLANLYEVPWTEEDSRFLKDLTKIAVGSYTIKAGRVSCAWCLAVLHALDAEIAGQVLQPEFVQHFSDSKDIQSQIHLQKLQSISLAAKYEVEGYSGPFLSEETLNSSQITTACSDKALNDALLNALRKFADLSTYTKLTQSLPGGITIDAIMCANKEGEVRPLSSTEGEGKNQMHMLAFQLVPFSGVVSPSETPSGSYQMTARHLRHLGYVPIQILYSDLRPSQSVLEHITNIKQKIKEAVTETVKGPHDDDFK